MMSAPGSGDKSPQSVPGPAVENQVNVSESPVTEIMSRVTETGAPDGHYIITH